MYIAQDDTTKIVGFGTTAKEAQDDLQLNICIHDIAGDATGIYKQRAKSLHPWLPLPQLLLVRNTCGILYEDGYLCNTITQERIKVADKKFCHYLYLYYLLSDSITYCDFTVVLQKEVDRFLKQIIPNCGTLSAYPYIKPGTLDDITSSHYLDNDVFITETRKGDAYIICAAGKVYEVQKVPDVETNCLLAYVLAKCGYKFNGENFRKQMEDL